MKNLHSSAVVVLSATFLIACFFAACSKSNSGPGYHITCKINGVSKSFNYNIDAERQTDDVSDMLGLTGSSTSSQDNGEFLVFILQMTNPGTHLATTTYLSDSVSQYTLRANYIVTGTNPSSIGYSDGTYENVNPDTNPLKFIIGAIDSLSIKGTFSGNLYYRDNQGNITTATVTDGDFYEKLK